MGEPGDPEYRFYQGTIIYLMPFMAEQSVSWSKDVLFHQVHSLAPSLEGAMQHRRGKIIPRELSHLRYLTTWQTIMKPKEYVHMYILKYNFSIQTFKLENFALLIRISIPDP